MEDVVTLLKRISVALTDGFPTLQHSRVSQLQLQPCKAFKDFSALCEDSATVKIFFESLSGPASQLDSWVNVWISSLVASSARFPPPSRALLDCGATETLAAFLRRLPQIINEASGYPLTVDPGRVFLIAGNLVHIAQFLGSSDWKLHFQLWRAGALEALLEVVPFRDLRSSSTRMNIFGQNVLDFISKAASLATDLAYAARLHKGETSNRLIVKAAAWAAALMERVFLFYQ